MTHFVAPCGFVEVSKLSQTQGGSPSITHLHGVVVRFDHD